MRGPFRDLFGDVTTLLTFNGTGANVLALANLLGPADAVVCSDWAHIAADETGAPERILGAKLIDLPADEASCGPTQSTGWPTFWATRIMPSRASCRSPRAPSSARLYTADEVAAALRRAHRLGMTVHIDGARIANAAAALGGDVATLRSFTVDAGVDVLTFGGTKNGLLGGEAVVFLRPGSPPGDVRAQAGHPAAVEDALRRRPVPGPARRRPLARSSRPTPTRWRPPCTPRRRHARHPRRPLRRSTACSRAARRADRAAAGLVVLLDLDAARNQVRWMTAWDTTPEDVATFAAGATVPHGADSKN